MDTTSLPPDDRPPVASPRRTNRGLLWAAALAVVVLAIATGVAFTAGGDDDAATLGGDPSIPGDLGGDRDVSGQAAPDVRYTTFDGEQVVLEPQGKPMVLNFWASYCAPCITEMPELEKSYAANGDRIDYLGIDVVDAPTKGLERIQQTGVTYPMGRDPQGGIFAAYGGIQLPRTALVSADGTIVAVHAGELDAEQLQAMIDEHFGG
jgi:thiol-disulfide isomerase/thioredoxin